MCRTLAPPPQLWHLPTRAGFSQAAWLGTVRLVVTRPLSPPQLNLSPVRLSELHADLKIQERDEFKWKKMKSEGLDEDGEKEAKLRRSLSGTSSPSELSLREAAPRARSPSSPSHVVWGQDESQGGQRGLLGSGGGQGGGVQPH